MATPKPRPLTNAINSIRAGNVAAFSGAPQDVATEALRQAHALTLLIRAGLNDAADLEDRGAEASVETLRPHIKANALEGIASLIALASAVIQEA